ncbi:MAG: DUF4115 domain-containing protein, partial [Acidimicrobiales bacterium]
TNGDGGKDLVFGDDTATSAPAPTATAGGAGRPSAFPLSRGLAHPRRGHRRSHGLGGARRSRIGSVVVAFVVLAAVAGTAVALAPSHHTPPPRHVATRKPQTKAHGGRTRTTTTTAPQVHPSAATASTAAYGAPVTGYTVALRASGLCWVEATDSSTGQVLWTGTLQTGQSQSIPATGTVLLRLGAADDVTVTLNGETVALPAGFQSPFDMTFAPA